MTSRTLTSILATAFLAAPLAYAQAPEKPEMPKPAPEMAQLAFFDGAWACEGRIERSPMGPGGKMTSTVKSQSDLDGFWQSGTVKSTMDGMPAFEGRFNMTYDAGAGQYVLLWIDSMGGRSEETAKGWQGDKIVFSGESVMGPGKVATRDTFVKTGDGTMKHSWEGQMNGNWAPMGSETCKKAAAAGK